MSTTTTTRSESLLPDLQRLVQDLKATCSNGSASTPRSTPGCGRRLLADREGGRTARRRGVARRLPGAGGGGLGAGLRLRPLPGGQRPDRRALPGRARRPPPGGRATATRHWFRAHPHDSDREYLLAVFARVGTLPAAARLFAGAQPAVPSARRATGPGRCSTSCEGRPGYRAPGATSRDPAGTRGSSATCTRICRRRRARSTPCCRRRSSSRSSSSTARSTPAIDEFGLEEVRMIDPTCGSGHFLLGAFRAAARRVGAAASRRRDADACWRSGRWTRSRGGPQPVRGGDRPLPAAGGGAAGLRRSRGWRTRPDFDSTSPPATACCTARSSTGATGRSTRRLPAGAGAATTLYAIEDAGGAGRASSAGSTTPSSATRPTSRSRTRR